ncbi:MAG: hypothetical protein HYV97_14515 [Bdellovibrio sp.]|nr:hypothetical protein [Bdellovibrio sp.]
MLFTPRLQRLIQLVIFGFALIALFIAAGHYSPDPDIWWRLKTGEWIFNHAQVPITDVFSEGGITRVWIEYNWLFDLIIYLFYKIGGGYDGVIFYTVILSSLIYLSLLALLKDQDLDPLYIHIISAIVVVGLIPVLTPRPWLISIFLYIWVLKLLLKYRETQNNRLLFFLPPIFCLWANIHIQFINGLVLLGILTLEAIMPKRRSTLLPTFYALSACAAITLLNPYGYLLYSVITQLNDPVYFSRIEEFKVPDFSVPSYLTFPLFAVLAIALLIRKRHEAKGFFLILVSFIGLILAFRARRDIWLALIPLAGLITSLLPKFMTRKAPDLDLKHITLILGSLVALLTIFTSPVSVQDISKHFPVAAVEFLKEQKLKGPIYNTFDWGGFLIWNLPEYPVAIDNRNIVYGPRTFLQSLETWRGQGNWSSDSTLLQSNIVIGPRSLPLSHLLQSDPRFKRIYSDKIAEVYTRIRP